MALERDSARRDEQAFSRTLRNLPRQRGQILPALLLLQGMLGYLTAEGQARIAAHLHVSTAEVERVADAFAGLRRRPPGIHLVRVCTGPECRAVGGAHLLSALAANRGIGVGETTADGRLSILEAACCFLCDMAPVLEVNGVCLGRVSEEAANAHIDALLARSPRGDELLH